MSIAGSIARGLGIYTGGGSPVQASAGSGELQSDDSGSFWAMVGPKHGTSAPITERTAMSLPAVLRALEVLTGVFAATPMIYYRRDAGGGKTRADTSPLYELFHARPNAVQSAFLFKEVMLGDMLMTGGFASFVHRDGMFQPNALSRLDPRGFRVNQQWDRTDGTELFYDAMLPDGSHARLSRSDCWHIPGFSRDGLLGINRIRLLDDMISSAVAAGSYARHFWENNAQPATIISAKGKMDAEARTAYKRSWREMFGGTRRAGEVAILDQEMSVDTLGATNRDSQFIEVRAFNVVDVARALGVPPHLLFELSKATFSNIEQQSLEFIMYNMMPHYERAAAAATHYFAEPDHYFEFMPDAHLKGDVKTRWEAYKAARESGVLSADEIRSRENLNAIGGPAGEERWRPANMAVSGEPNPTAAPAAPAQ